MCSLFCDLFSFCMHFPTKIFLGTSVSYFRLCFILFQKKILLIFCKYFYSILSLDTIYDGLILLTNFKKQNILVTNLRWDCILRTFLCFTFKSNLLLWLIFTVQYFVNLIIHSVSLEKDQINQTNHGPFFGVNWSSSSSVINKKKA